MKIHHLHFYVADAAQQGETLIRTMGCERLSRRVYPDRLVERLRYGTVELVFSSPHQLQGPVGRHLERHGPGVVDVALAVEDLEAVARRLAVAGLADRPVPAASLAPQDDQAWEDAADGMSSHRMARLVGWGNVHHTLLAVPGSAGAPAAGGIDHIVLNVPVGELEAASNYYRALLGFDNLQQFSLHTGRSGLSSQVLAHPEADFYFNLNEPQGSTSQIQAFLDTHRGAGIQHVAFRCPSIVATVAALRARGFPMLHVAAGYHQQTRQRLASSPQPPLPPGEWEQLVEQRILVDWHLQVPAAVLLQIFSRPVFAGGHFFFEWIERRKGAQGFGRGNFQALYEAVEAQPLLGAPA